MHSYFKAKADSTCHLGEMKVLFTAANVKVNEALVEVNEKKR